MVKKFIIVILVGGGLGYAYYRFIGCSSGTCPLTSNPYISTVYGMVVGALAAITLRKTKPRK